MIDKEGLHKLLNLGELNSAVTFIIYSDKITNRLQYVCEFIFEQLLKVNYVLVNDRQAFEASTNFKINYTNSQIENSFQIFPQDLLYEKGITEKKPSAEIKNGQIYFYSNSEKNSFHFDVFSAVFYFISRYEEWQTFNKDEHQRFELKESILYKSNFHLKPVVELWVEELKTELQKQFINLIFPQKEFKTIATIDVDNLFAYKSKGFIRTLGAALKDLVKLNFGNIMRRNRVINGVEEDPFDIYESFSKFCADKNVPLIYFFLFKTGTKFDRTVDPSSNGFLNVFNIVKKYNAYIGIHPSYFSFNNAEVLSGEVKNISEKINSEVKLSRQHYLRFDIKTTPNLLLSNNIFADLSMGFASGAGFRAGTSQPFYYYNLSAEERTDLLLVPFCAMDGAYFVYDKISPDETLKLLLALKEEIKKVNGLFITVFHERTFAEHLYPGFGEMYKKLLS